MKPKCSLCLALILIGCATQSQRGGHADRCHVVEAALRYEFNHWNNSIPKLAEDGTKYVLEDGECTPWLVSEFHSYKPTVVSLVDYHAAHTNTIGTYIFWSAKVQVLKDDRATIYVRFYSWLESQGGYILELHREKRRWIVDSEKFSHSGL